MRYDTLIIIVVLFSCTSKKEKPPKEKTNYEKKLDLDSISKTKAQELSVKYNAVSNWTKPRQYTYKLQEALEDTVISFTGYLSDIIKRRADPFEKYGGHMIKDKEDPLGILSNYLLKISSLNSRYIAEISISNSQLKEIEQTVSKKVPQKGCFIFKVKRITSMFPILSSDGEAEIYGGNEEV